MHIGNEKPEVTCDLHREQAHRVPHKSDQYILAPPHVHLIFMLWGGYDERAKAPSCIREF